MEREAETEVAMVPGMAATVEMAMVDWEVAMVVEEVPVALFVAGAADERAPGGKVVAGVAVGALLAGRDQEHRAVPGYIPLRDKLQSESHQKRASTGCRLLGSFQATDPCRQIEIAEAIDRCHRKMSSNDANTAAGGQQEGERCYTRLLKLMAYSDMQSRAHRYPLLWAQNARTYTYANSFTRTRKRAHAHQRVHERADTQTFARIFKDKQTEQKSASE
eukprot:4150421-Pleurochrysis_carterae.AAC.1